MPAKQSDKHLIDGAEQPFSFTEEPGGEDRKRYTTQLQRRAQAHITAELGGTTVVPDLDRQVTMVVQHAQQSTGARRVSLFRPVSRGRRWHVATVLGDGTFYYGLASPETLSWSRHSFEQRRPVLYDTDDHAPQSGPELNEIGIRSYLGVPILADGRAVAVIEAVDVNQTGELEHYSSQLEESASSLAQRLGDLAVVIDDVPEVTGSNRLDVNADTVLDLVLRQPYEVDETFEVAPNEWSILNHVDGERSIRSVAEKATMPVSQVIAVSAALVDRGLVRIGKENRRRL
jgi:GAF domain-containing protein